MKILITSDLYLVGTNGVVTSIKNLKDALERRGHEVKVISISDKHKSYRDGDAYFIRSIPIKVYNGTRMPTTYRHKLIRELICWKPDVIHSQCEFFSFLFAHYISRKTGAPIVHTYHTMYEDYVGYVFPIKCIGRKITRKVTKLFLEGWVDAVIVPTEKVKRRHMENGIHCDFNVIPSGIDLEKYKTRISAEERADMRRRFGISDDEVLLLNLGRLGSEKNINEIINLYAKEAKNRPKLKLMIVGDGPARAELEHLASELGLSDRIVFAGMVSPNDVGKFYQLGDIFVSASTSETQGLTYIEAAANGLPLLCRYDECLENVIVRGENGYSYTTDEEFFTSLENLLSAEGGPSSFGRKSEKIIAPYDKRVFAETVESIYTEVISEAKTRESFKKRRVKK